MSNLGWYQWITTASKKVGGPLNLLAIIGGGCLAVGGTVGSVITNKYRDIKDKKELKLTVCVFSTLFSIVLYLFRIRLNFLLQNLKKRGKLRI